MTIRILAAAAVLALAGCSGGDKAATAEAGKFGGLDTQIRAWRDQIVATQDGCKAKTPDGQPGCINFEETCKAEGVLPQGAPQTARVITGLRWEAWDAKHGEHMTASGIAQFDKAADGTWTRTDLKGGDMTTCRPY